MQIPPNLNVNSGTLDPLHSQGQPVKLVQQGNTIENINNLQGATFKKVDKGKSVMQAMLNNLPKSSLQIQIGIKISQAVKSVKHTLNALRKGIINFSQTSSVITQRVGKRLLEGYPELPKDPLMAKTALDRVEMKPTEEEVAIEKNNYREARSELSKVSQSINDLIFRRIALNKDIKSIDESTEFGKLIKNKKSDEILNIEAEIKALELQKNTLNATIAKSKSFLQAEINEILKRNPQIIVVENSIDSSDVAAFLDTLALYEAGQLNLYRGMQQWYHTFPKDDEYKDINPKNPGSEDLPDFAYNENSWVAMSPTESTSRLVACSWTDQYAEFFNNQGGIDSSKPVAVVFKIAVGPPVPIAFAMDGEIQIKGPLQATEVTHIMIDDPWGDDDNHTFRQFAQNSNVPIN